MRLSAVLITAGLCLYACTRQQDDLGRLRDYLTGSFSSADQAAADSNFSDIRLEMAPVWENRTDGYWIYVEQASAGNLSKPYRQRIYRLTQENDSTFLSTVYTMPDPLRFAGAFKNKDLLQSLSPDSLTERDGCAVVLTRYSGDMFVGSTAGLNCDSDLRNAAYATSIVIVSKDQIYSWDRGYDINGNQVWGAEKGGYIFKKKSDYSK